MSDRAVIEARGLVKEYEGQRVVDGVSMQVRAGEVKVVMGPSGSGKSTFLRCMALLEQTDAGELFLDGEAVGARQVGSRRVMPSERQLAAVRAEIGMVFQSFNLFPHMTAEENVMSGLVTVRRVAKAEARATATATLERVGLAKRARAYPAELSGGQQQRVAIARALVMSPKALLFDEPTSALDVELVREVLDVIEGLASGGMTMVVVTHELSLARRIAHDVCIMDAGRIIEAGSPAQLFSEPRETRTRTFLEAVQE
jgi:polar amino acid transport system ATP-binding protein